MFFQKKRQKILILGSGLPAERIARVIEKSAPHYEILGFVDDQPGGAAGIDPNSSGSGRGPLGSSLYALRSPSSGALRSSPCALRSLGPLRELQSIVTRLQPARIVIALSERRGKLPVRECLDFRMNGIVVEDWVEVYERITGKVAIESLSPSSFLFSKMFEKSPFRSMIYRSLDIIYASVGLLLTAPLFAVIAVAIKLDSEGPVLFVHPRMGYGGQPFDLLKFRTMVPSSESSSEWARDHHARVTRVGRILRKFRLDELPQYINILFGQMALIGPRPHPVTNAGLFFDEIPYYLVRSNVRPGVTGWAQVRMGYANDLDEETEKMRYDLYYIKHQSVLFDLRILFETIRTVLFGRGSEQTTEASDYDTNRTREHEYGWQTTYKGTTGLNAQLSALSSQHSADSIQHSAFSPQKSSAHRSPLSAQPYSSSLDDVSSSAHCSALTAQRSSSPLTAQRSSSPLSAHRSSSDPSASSTLDARRATLDGPPLWSLKFIDATDLSFYGPMEQELIASEIRAHLPQDPLVETRNRRKLNDNRLAPWELRTDKYRIFYEAKEELHQVTVVAVGHKEHDRLFLRGIEVTL